MAYLNDTGEEGAPPETSTSNVTLSPSSTRRAVESALSMARLMRSSSLMVRVAEARPAVLPSAAKPESTVKERPPAPPRLSTTESSIMTVSAASFMSSAVTVTVMVWVRSGSSASVSKVTRLAGLMV